MIRVSHDTIRFAVCTSRYNMYCGTGMPGMDNYTYKQTPILLESSFICMMSFIIGTKINNFLSSYNYKFFIRNTSLSTFSGASCALCAETCLPHPHCWPDCCPHTQRSSQRTPWGVSTETHRERDRRLLVSCCFLLCLDKWSMRT